ncbi:uncharacterized protein TEOVI_000271500 [Trypanosoma equiperdum]|uniref:Uncharacterized protein n=1 Tax=Trypanosoma equiperdum TaxID=5694 RepID=A0A1G4IFR8_TRYEQ|nr:hypothetical protein, conserved [Trypanosoma equiperdum]
MRVCVTFPRNYSDPHAAVAASFLPPLSFFLYSWFSFLYIILHMVVVRCCFVCLFVFCLLLYMYVWACCCCCCCFSFIFNPLTQIYTNRLQTPVTLCQKTNIN